jgi:four helix bundle protein
MERSMPRFQGDLPQWTFRFAMSVLDLVERLPQGTLGWVSGKQLARSGTSVGANVREADGALTDAEFAYTCNVARKEAAETQYWLEICAHRGLSDNDEAVRSALQESQELQRILATIVRKLQVART